MPTSLKPVLESHSTHVDRAYFLDLQSCRDWLGKNLDPQKRSIESPIESEVMESLGIDTLYHAISRRNGEKAIEVIRLIEVNL